MKIRWNPTSGRRDQVDGSPCYFEVDKGNGPTERMSRRQCYAAGFTKNDIDDACVAHGKRWVRCFRFAFPVKTPNRENEK